MLTAVDQGHARNLPELMETVEVGELLMPAGCQERRTNADLLSFVHEREAQEVSEPVTLTNPIAPVELFPITEGKLAVSIADEVLILHSPTEKQLSAYLEQNTLPAAAELVLSISSLRRVRRRDCGRTRDWTCRAPIRKARSHGSSKRSNTWRQEKTNQAENHS